MDIETLKKEVTDLDLQIATANKEIEHQNTAIYWAKKRRKLVLAQIAETEEMSLDTLKKIENLK